MGKFNLAEQYVRQAAEKDPFYRNIMERFGHHFNQEKDIDNKKFDVEKHLATQWYLLIKSSGRTVGKLYFELVKRSNSSGSRSSTLAGVKPPLILYLLKAPWCFLPSKTEVIPPVKYSVI